MTSAVNRLRVVIVDCPSQVSIHLSHLPLIRGAARSRQQAWQNNG